MLAGTRSNFNLSAGVCTFLLVALRTVDMEVFEGRPGICYYRNSKVRLLNWQDILVKIV